MAQANKRRIMLELVSQVFGRWGETTGEPPLGRNRKGSHGSRVRSPHQPYGSRVRSPHQPYGSRVRSPHQPHGSRVRLARTLAPPAVKPAGGWVLRRGLFLVLLH